MMDGDILFCNVAGQLHCWDPTGTKKRWEYELKTGYATALAYAKGMVFIATSERELIALVAANRRTVWSGRTRSWCFEGIGVEGDILYVAAGDLYALRAVDGGQIWVCQSAPGAKRGF